MRLLCFFQTLSGSLHAPSISTASKPARLTALRFQGLTLLAVSLLFVTPNIQAQVPSQLGKPLDITPYLKGELAAAGRVGLKSPLEALQSGQSDKAISELRRLKDSPSRVKRIDLMLYLEALALAQRGSIADAIESAQQSLALKGSNSDLLYLYSELLTNPQRKLDALTQALWFDRFLSISPAMALSKQALLLMQHGETKRAEAVAQKAIVQDPSCVECRVTLAQLLLQGGKKQDALLHLRQAVSQAPSDTAAKIALARTMLAGAKRSTDSALIDEAEQLSEDLYATHGPSSAEVALLYAQALVESGQLTKASEVVKAARKETPSNPSLERLVQQIQLEKQTAPHSEGPETPAAPAPK